MAGDYAQTVAASIVKQLEDGTAPWVKPWEPSGLRFIPYNATTGKDYQGGNAIWLMAVAEMKGCGFRRIRPGIPILIRPAMRRLFARGFRDLFARVAVSVAADFVALLFSLGQAIFGLSFWVLRRLSPVSSIRWALWSRRSRMASA